MVLIREIAKRRHFNYIGILLLGCAYAAVEEGLACKSFFDPNWMDLNIFSWYGRWMGVNWPWLLELTIYHAVFSITIPIILVEYMFPERIDECWVSGKALIALILLFVVDVLFINHFISNYTLSFPQLFFTFTLIFIFILSAFLSSNIHFFFKGLISPRRLWFYGMIWGFSMFFIYIVLPRLQPFPAVIILLGLIHIYLIYKIFRNHIFASFDFKNGFYFSSGVLTYLIALTPIHEFNVNRSDNPHGMIFIGLFFSLFLIWLWRRGMR